MLIKKVNVNYHMSEENLQLYFNIILTVNYDFRQKQNNKRNIIIASIPNRDTIGANLNANPHGMLIELRIGLFGTYPLLNKEDL